MKRIAMLGAVQILVILGWAAYHERVRATAPVFRIPLRPSDPFDVIRGRYFVLNPLDAAIETGGSNSLLTESEVEHLVGSNRSFSGAALVGFCPQDGLARVCALARPGEQPEGGPARFWSRAFVTVLWQETEWRNGREAPLRRWHVRCDLRLNRFFIPNRLVLPARENELGWELELSHRPGQTPLPRALWFRGRPVYD